MTDEETWVCCSDFLTKDQDYVLVFYDKEHDRSCNKISISKDKKDSCIFKIKWNFGAFILDTQKTVRAKWYIEKFCLKLFDL